MSGSRERRSSHIIDRRKSGASKGPQDIWYSPYELQLKDFAEAPPRRGALIRINGGVADLHPWPELGDLSLEEELESLQAGTPTPLAFKSEHFASLDRVAREAKINLLEGLSVPENHLHLGRISKSLELGALSTRIEAHGFKRLKVKMSDFFSPEEFLQFRKLIDFTKGFKDLKVRIDFNYSFGERAHDFEDLLNTFSNEDLDQIDFIEDPFLFEDHSWIKMQDLFDCRFALDRGDFEIKTEEDTRDDKGTAPFSVVVIKPALEEVQPIVETAARNMRRVVCTSYLDHPVGQLCAAYETGLMLKQHPLLFDACGLLSHVAYKATPFSEALKVSGTQLLGAEGSGWGFDELLATLDWKKL